MFFGPRRTAEPWSVRVADAESGAGRELWRAAEGPGSAFHEMVADNQLFWGAGDRIVFPWEKTGFLHLYSVSTHGGAPTPLNANGEFEIEHVSLSSDAKTVLFSSNQDDIDRRHLWRVSVLGEGLTPVTRGEGLEWSPLETADGKAVVDAPFRSQKSRARRDQDRGHATSATWRRIPSLPNFRQRRSWFRSRSCSGPRTECASTASFSCRPICKPGEKRPAMIFFHGGSRRQMLLGWHYMDYYHNAYGMNQYLASLGYVVLSVNYRSGIGYGLDFREAINYGAIGRKRVQRRARRRPVSARPRPMSIPSASACGAAPTAAISPRSACRALPTCSPPASTSTASTTGARFATRSSSDLIRGDQNAVRIAFESSPMASVGTWRSPVLLIHGDDDRNVDFRQTVMLVEALRKQHVEFEELIFPDEIHGFLTAKRWLEAYHAAADFLSKHL